MADDPIAKAAEVVDAKDVPKDALKLGADGKPATEYKSPFAFKADPWAARINDILDKIDPYEKGSVWENPAETCMVGECVMATGDAMGLGSKEKTSIHPGYLLLASLVAFAIVVGIGYWLKSKEQAKEQDRKAKDPERRKRLADIE